MILPTASSADASKLLGVRGALLESAQRSMAQILEGRPVVLPAWQRYAGVVWSYLDPGRLSSEQRTRLLVPSGLYGLTTAEDPVADYRLKMSVNLGTLGVLSRFWRDPVTAVVVRRARGAELVNLLPSEHAACLDFDALGAACEVRHVRFVSTDGRHAVGHGAKAVKGIVARRVLEQGSASLTRFRWEGWRAARSSTGFDVHAPG